MSWCSVTAALSAGYRRRFVDKYLGAELGEAFAPNHVALPSLCTPVGPQRHALGGFTEGTLPTNSDAFSATSWGTRRCSAMGGPVAGTLLSDALPTMPTDECTRALGPRPTLPEAGIT